MNGRLLTRRTASALVASLALGLAGTAGASTVRVSNNELLINDAAGEVNVLTYWRGADEGGKQVIFVHQATGPQDLPQDYPEDAPPPPAGVPFLGDLLNGCESAGEGTVKCKSGGAKFTAVKATLGANKDFISNPVTDDSQPLDAATAVTLDGGEGNDVLLGSTNGDTLLGGAGNDDLRGLTGGDTLRPGDGQNTLRGGDGTDVVDFSTADRTKANMATGVSLDGFPNDGAGCTTALVPAAACEANNVSVDVENVRTGNGDDTILGSDLANEIATNGGNDVAMARGGDDKVLLGDGTNSAIGGEGNDELTGGANVDTLEGGNGDDKLAGAAGNNSLLGGDGADTISATDGNDTVEGGLGNDVVHAGDGTNTISLGAGNDGVAGDPATTGGAGADTIDAGPGDDVVTAGAGNNDVTGGAGDDQITTLGGDDFVAGNDGTDEISTGAGNDKLQGGLGADGLDAGAEDMARPFRTDENGFNGDTIDYSDKAQPVYAIAGDSNSGTSCEPPVENGPAPASCEGDSITSAENFIGGSAGDHLIGDDAHANTLDGRGGSDILKGKGGDDHLLGGDGDDSQLVGGTGADTVEGGNGTDSVSYIDTPQESGGVMVTLDGQPGDGAEGEDDNLFPDLENIEGSNQDDYLEGSDGPNSLWGRQGDDELVGKGNADFLDGNGGVDLVNYEGRQDNLGITLDDVANDGGGGEGDNVSSSVENITSGDGNDTIVASGAANAIVASGGNDVIDGLLGADDLRGGEGTDTVVYSARPGTEKVQVTLDDVNNDGTTVVFGGLSLEKDNVHFDVENLTGGDEADYFEGGVQPNTLLGGGGDDQLFGDQENDVLAGGAGNDELHGGTENDVLTPGLGADIVSGEADTDAVDYSERTGAVSVTFDNEANDGEAGEGDNVLSDVEQTRLREAAAPAPQPEPQPDPEPEPDPAPAPAADDSANGGASVQTTKVEAASGKKRVAQKRGTALEVLSKATGARKVLVRGRILVKASAGLAQAAAACKGGGKVRVTLRKAGKVVGKRVVKLGRTCAFRAPVGLAKGAKGKLEVEVRFLGNRALKAAKRTTSLQVNG